MKTQTHYLATNPLIRVKHYQLHFRVSETTARKMLAVDRDAIGCRIYTFQDFYSLYEAFPCPIFRPRWISKENHHAER